ncbi:MAG TPA: FtsK/SpoIIIE domain-containing protein, partial [Gemmataceae bacterium]
ENVIQKYLRNQYKSIEEYNAEAGEVAEPLRVLVVANFPVNFSPEAARRLVSIASSGPGCGVYTLVHVDPKQPMPQGFRLADLEQACPNLVWKQDRLQWKDGPLAQFPLEVEAPPPPEQLARLVRWVGERSRDAKRVEVPFEFIAPEEEEIWAGDSRRGISVPLGRAGATKRQRLELGQGTSQHVVIAGKTGSGKSTLLHALVTSAALRYSPDEVELYLIDFKKGVEFKAYAAHKLPHARVIAIESEREFGLSVLQRLDAELKQRGDRFRDAGVNDLAGYREARPAERCPRILLIVDEFQEFFTEDDKLAQEAGLLLDRLVRQGRAFGLHVLLGSQTLGGAYSLARSTIDQMAVRIALQCSEADAQLVLNRDNSAARLLSRPGEAIYNDANGAVEGNDIFQVVWLSDATRDRWLRRLEGRGWSGSGGHAPIVFEGSAPAELEHNPLLRRLLEAPGWPEDVRAASGWLGEAVAIKDPTAALFRPMSGNNLLVIGQHEEAARAVLSAALISLAAQHAPSEATPARFHVLDGTAPDDPRSGHLTEVTAVLPHAVRWVERGEVGAALGELAAEVERRQQDPDVPRDAVYLFVHGLQRFRDLRRDEDDFGFARRGGERQVSPSEHLLMLLREGPAVGVHLILWCDSLTNLNRSLDRPSLRECGMRVLFQMGAGDSSHLIDSPLAARLGRYRALFYHEELGLIEKFRPYGLPRRAWLEEVGRRLHRRVAARVG